MTGRQRRGDTPMGPPWSVDVLADLHAGVLDEAGSGQLWPRVRADPAAREVLAALDSTVTELRGLRDIPPVPMPVDVAARLDAAIGAEAAARATAPPGPAPAPVIDLARARQRRYRRMGWGAGILAAAAAVTATVLVLAVPHGGTTGQAVAPPNTGSSSGAPVALRSGHLDAGTALAAIGRSDYGPLDAPGRLAGCLAAHGQDPNRPPAGGARVTLDGRPGVLLVLTTGQTARFRLLIVGPDCSAGNPDTLADTVVGGVPTR